MTVSTLYTFLMNTFHLLISLTMQGMLWTFLLIALSFGGVYAAELCKLGWAHKRDEPKPQEPPPPTEKQPVYYLVEKSPRRPKS